ncbi:hypothetical protein M5K25_004722 [Dendrobium thyrsiflorum]|uniref:Uncharacterized protein n=1 Tax=Dendrobium thyrsiflorum TaxID=117978 RepID=A0ABD0VFR7_DENTH
MAFRFYLIPLFLLVLLFTASCFTQDAKTIATTSRNPDVTAEMSSEEGSSSDVTAEMSKAGNLGSDESGTDTPSGNNPPVIEDPRAPNSCLKCQGLQPGIPCC